MSHIQYVRNLTVHELLDTIEEDLKCLADPDWDGDHEDAVDCTLATMFELRQRVVRIQDIESDCLDNFYDVSDKLSRALAGNFDRWMDAQDDWRAVLTEEGKY